MTARQIIEQMQEAAGRGLVQTRVPRPSRLYVTIEREALPAVAELLFRRLGGRYVVGGGTDKRAEEGCFLVSHFFAIDTDNVYVVVHTQVPAEDPWVPSITPMIPGANWAEREIYDTVGVRVEGHPDPRRLVLSDDWPQGIHPLRADQPHNIEAPYLNNPQQDLKAAPDGAHVVPIGPFFPVLEEPAHFRVFVEGEMVVGCDYRGFYSHRGIEKLACTELTYNQVPFIAERICGICGFVHSCSYCMAVEEAAGIEIPDRARYIRTVMLELERLHSHLLWLGIAGHIIGFDTLLMQTWRMREPLMWLAEEITGNRKTYGMNLVGGVRRDFSAEAVQKTLKVLDDLEREWKALMAAIPGDATLMARLQGLGVLSREQAVDLCVTGPIARASGLPLDVRVDHPYAAYRELKSKRKVMGEGGDVLARTLVRMEETLVAIELIREALAQMPGGPIFTEFTEEIPPGQEGIAAIEAPRGEVVHWVLTGENNRPERWRVRAPTYANLQTVPAMVTGDTLADVPIGIGSIDPCFSCTERFEVVDANSGRVRVYSVDELTGTGKQTKQG